MHEDSLDAFPVPADIHTHLTSCCLYCLSLVLPVLLPVMFAAAAVTGAFVGAWGTVTWEFNAPESNDPSRYSFDIYLPKVHKDKDYKESEKQYKYDEDKY